MSKETKVYKKIFQIQKLNLCYNGLINLYEIFKIKNDKTEKAHEHIRENEEDKEERVANPLCCLLSGMEYLQIILKQNDINVLEYLYLNRYIVHEIIYKEDATINVISDYLTNFKDYYYLYFLIKAEPELNNYEYDFSLVQKAVGFQNEGNEKLGKIIKAKIVLTIIKSHEGYEEENPDYKDMENPCIKNINDNKNILEKYKIKLDLENLADDNIDINEIYIDILQYLIINQKLDESDETSNLLKELEIKNIRINKNILEALKEVLTEKYLRNYKFESFEDLFESKEKLTFYFSLFENILKDSIYIYEIPFLLEQRKNIHQIIKNNSINFHSQIKKGKNVDGIHKLKTILTFFSIACDFYDQKGKELRDIKKQESIISNNNFGSSKNPSNNSNYSNGGVASQGDSSSSNYNNSNSSGGSNPFEKPSYKNRSNGSYSFYDEHGEKDIDKNNEIAYLILCESKFKFNIIYDKKEDKARMEFKEITYKDKINDTMVEISYDKYINESSSDDTINSYFDKLKSFFDQIEKDISKKYKKEKETEIIMNIELNTEKENKLDINASYKINDGIERDESNYLDKDFLNNNTHTGIGCVIDDIIED